MDLAGIWATYNMLGMVTHEQSIGDIAVMDIMFEHRSTAKVQVYQGFIPVVVPVCPVPND